MPSETTADRYRLPRSVAPVRYELTLEPDLDAATFAGEETVEVEVVEAVDEIVVNAIELEIDEAWVATASGDRVDATVTLDAETERAHLALASTVGAGTHHVHLRFRGILNDKLHGFYLSTFTDPEGVERRIATTQFEATDARRAFPCWDEPDFKAVFACSLVVADGLLAVSNAREIGTEPTGDGRVRVRFADTMKMSTYLVAFVVGPLEATDPVDVSGTPVRIIHRPGRGHLTGFALEAAAFSLDFLADYFGIPYPGDKLDLVAIPDFAFGAMENLGCVTFREVLLLVDEAATTHAELVNVSDVIAHELAHMWFGDLVTMKWWNGIWLNEAFATFMEMLTTDAFRPAWERWVAFGMARAGAFDVDSLAATRPIEFPVISPDDAEGMFDVLTYEKGAAVVRMLEQYLGAEPFRSGIRRYMQLHRYANTETTDLWDAIEEATAQPTRRIMDSWIFQGGHPVVNASLEAGGRVLRLSQEPFRYLDAEAGEGQWAIPMIVTLGDGDGTATTISKLLLDGDALEVDVPEAATWVVANTGGSGFYRVRYDGDLLHALVGRLDRLSAIERFGLVDDTWASVLAGTTDAAQFLDLARGFGDETDPNVWRRLVGALGQLERVVDGDAQAELEGRVRALVGPALLRLGVDPADGEDATTRELRAVLFEAMGVLGDDDAVHERARAIQHAYLADSHSVEPTLAAAALGVMAAGADAGEFDTLLGRFRDAATPQEEQRYLYSLAAVRDRALFDRVLELALSDDVRSQNAPYLLRGTLLNREHGPEAWGFIRRNWDAANSRFPSNSIVRMLEGVRQLNTPEVAADVEAFFAEHEVPQGAKTLSQHLERMRVSAALREREHDRLTATLLA